MKSISIYIALLLVLIGCNDEPSLQKYFVENSDNKDFVAVDVSPSILKLDQMKLTAEQTKALKSFDKMNVLAFKCNGKNQAQFETERAKVNAILKEEKYQQLMKFGSGKDGASVSFVGEDEHINEFVVYANKAENGFAIVRVLGKDMSPTAIMNMISMLKDSKLNLDQFKPLQELMSK
ncbi:DUF4252 domain-containing protein [Flavobacterium sp.]|uniref:DUF4252 domain-containing protein n=1 Tax=Flavobacterium sp. TaxID=239 RepID=UPI002618B8C2|nr:DUF4252 domain-containing protein [Flavobacterium sp.]